MRSAILVIFSAIGLAGLFIAYWVLQPTTPISAVAGKNPVVPPRPKHVESAGGIRPGDNAWLRQYKDGEVSSEFRGEQYHPRPNGTIDVTNPIAKFYLANRQRLEITGVRGNVVVKEIPDPAKGGFGGGGTVSPPSKGRLDDVTVKLVDESLPPGEQVTLTMRTNNAVFDNEAFIIYTEGYRDADGHDVAADQVPVEITGKIRMKGRGLKVRWNDNDGRLELLEVAHGQLLIIDLDAMKRENARRPARAAWIGPPGPIPVMLAARDQKSAGEVITSYRPPATEPKAGKTRSASTGPVTYRASFFENVRINQLDPTGTFDQLLIDNVNRMDYDFVLKQTGDKPAATKPAAKAPQSASGAAPGQTETPDKPVRESSPADQAVTPSEDKQKPQPVYVRWTGMLRITPIASAPYVPLKPGDSAVKLTGAPVLIHRIEPGQQGMEETRSASVLYASSGDNVWLDCSPQFPQTTVDRMPDASLADQRITHLVSMGRVQYSGVLHLARMTGPGNADVPLAREPGSQPTQLHAAWSKLAEFDFSALDAQGQPAVKAGHFQGDVDVNHPRLNLRSQQLDLQFATSLRAPVPAPGGQKNRPKPQSQTNLESVVATTAVNCELIDSDGKKKNIDAEHLTLETATADGKLYPRHVFATGSPVHAYADDDLKADALDVLLRPVAPVARTARASQQRRDSNPESAAVELEELVATGHVIAKSKDASTAIGDRLVVNGGKDKLHTILTSAANAKVISAKGDLVTGPRIEFNSGDGRAYIIGPGMLYSLHQGSATQPAEPVKVTWTTGAQFDGAVNRIDADGSIVAESTDRRGFVNKATGDHVRIDLRNKPPATQPVLAAARVPKSVPAQSDSIAGDVKMDLFKDKEVAAMTLDGNADMNSTLTGPDGMIIQQMVLEGPRIIVQQLAPDGTKAMTITVPTVGKMLVRDNRPSAGADKSAAAPSEAQGQGSTVFNWQKSMVFNDAAHRADMDGAVQIIHLDNQSGKDAAAKVDMVAEHVTAWFEPPPEKKPAAAKPAQKPAEASEDAHIQLKMVTALSGPNDFVVVTRGADQMQARRIDYDPGRHVLTGIGSPRNPVNFFTNGTIQSQAERIEWDTITWAPKLFNVILNAAPAQPPVQSPKAKPKLQPQPYRPGQRSNP
jgi:hypothetical protein